jgi:hypothetical protein
MNNQSILEIVIKAKDEASSQLNSLQGNLKNMEGSFTTMRNVGVGAFAAISGLIYKTTGDYAEAEKSSKMLEHAVLNVSHATQEQFEATSKLADELERKGVLDGDNIKQGLAQLSTFGLSNKAVQALGGSLSDLAVNQFGVNASGEQLSDTANMIAKALNGQFGVLEKSGIRFTEAQKHAIKYGSEMEKVTAINEGFAQNLKFTNEVALSTMEGQMAKSNVQIGNMSEAIGESLTPIIIKLQQAIVPIVQKVLDWINANQDLVAKIVVVAGAIAGVLAVIGTLGLIIPSIISGITFLSSAVSALGVVFTFLAANPIVLIIAAIAALVAGIVWCIYHWDQVKAKALEVWTAMQVFISGAVDAITSKVRGWVTAAYNSIVGVFTAVKTEVTNIWESIKSTITGVIDSILAKVQAMVDSVRNAYSAATSFVGGAVSSVFGGKRAAGGPVTGGTSYLVGENGPELFTPNSTGAIIPNNNLGGSIILNITGNNFLGDDEVADKIGAAIMRSLQFQAKF